MVEVTGHVGESGLEARAGAPERVDSIALDLGPEGPLSVEAPPSPEGPSKSDGVSQKSPAIEGAPAGGSASAQSDSSAPNALISGGVSGSDGVTAKAREKEAEYAQAVGDTALQK